ncbi:uncharacterized protein LOC135817636 [Sycon ciliatum]|uniref:uncharacterized protein LOC135817636 n=1 Tax=Sycon ciliatum TaxID=27933 RepID=UPI0020ABA99D
MPDGGIARLKQGWLIKQGGRVKNWKRRFFVLDGNRRLTYYVSEADARAGVNQLGIIDLDKALFVKPRGTQARGSANIAWPASVSSDFCFMIITNDRNYGIYSDISVDDCRNWVSALQAVRGNVDSNEIMVEISANNGAGGEDEQTDHYGAAAAYPGRPRANTVAAVNAYKAMPERYNMPPDLLPKVVVMYARWHRVLERSLESLAEHFNVKSFKLECDMTELYARAPKAMRNRLGELVFGDYIDELRYNLMDLVGNEPVGKIAFVEATQKRVIKFQYGDLEPDEVVRAQPVNGIIRLTVPAKQLGKGVHLTGKHFFDRIVVGVDDFVCGGQLKGLPLPHAMDVCRARKNCTAALQRVTKLLSLEVPLLFKCNYQSVHNLAEGYLAVRSHLGTVIIKNLLTELGNAVHTQVPPLKRLSFGGIITAHRVVFEMADDDDAKETATINHNGDLVLAAGLKKLQELAVYGRPGHFNLASLVKLCGEESSM